jgi:flagellar L-ring protein precursor FlgH
MIKQLIYCGSLLWCSLLWSADLVNIDQLKPLTADKKARSVGDVVTLLVLEDAKAGSSTNLRDVSDTGIDVVAGRDQQNWQYGLGVGLNQRGDAATQRNGFIKTHITVQIISKDPHGLFEVNGTQRLKINGEEQLITVSGKLRADDISSVNTALSSRLLDATISFTGEGTVSAGQESGLINRILRWFGMS